MKKCKKQIGINYCCNNDCSCYNHKSGIKRIFIYIYRIAVTLFTVIMAITLTSCQNSKESVVSETDSVDKNIINYADAESFESALNNGENLEGKIVQFIADELHPNSAYGYNIWAGEHLNFVSSENPNVKENDTIIVKVTKVESNLGSWFIHYEKLDNAKIDNKTTSFDINKFSETTTAAAVRKEENRYFGKIIFDNDKCYMDTGSNIFIIDTSNFKNIEKFKDVFNEVKLDCRATGTDNNMLKISSFTYDKIEYTPETFDNITQPKTSTTTSKAKTTTTTTTTKTTTKATTTTTATTTLKNPSSVSEWGWSGSGDFVATDLQVENYAIITASHDGSHNFIIRAHNDDGSEDLLVNTIGGYFGSTLIVGSGTYELEIIGDGNWSVNAYALSTTEDTSFSGTGDFVTPIFYAKNSNWNITNNGEHNFIVKQYGINSERYDLLVNEVGSYSGIVKSDVAYETFFEIKSEGSWSISPA